METDCVVCSTHMAHYLHEPMNMGCECMTRVCHACVTRGHLLACPTCRRRRPRPSVDRKWCKMMREQYAERTLACIGCHREYPVGSVRVHEESCVANRNRIDDILRAEMTTCIERASRIEEERDELQTQIDLRDDDLAEMEQQSDDLQAMLGSHELERQVYTVELNTLSRQLRSIVNPLESITRRIATVTERVKTLNGVLNEARRGHTDLQRRRQRGEIMTAGTLVVDDDESSLAAGEDEDEPGQAPDHESDQRG
jgi:DNA repair exonuclease SbcCD ATPase subunit